MEGFGIIEAIMLLGGVAFFLFGMNTMGTGLKKLAGNKMEAILWKLSSTPIKGFLLGTLVAAVIQSSGATTVMIISFVSAGMMKLSQAVSVVLGANIGTTMTGWILTLSGSSGKSFFSAAVLLSVFAIVGAILYMFCKTNVKKSVGMVLLGLAVLLLSMSQISEAVKPLTENEQFTHLLILFKNPLLGMLVGLFVAAILQSCSAGVGVLQALCVSGAIPYSVCLPIILGINIGASTPVLIAMTGSSKNGKRTALSYLITNVLSAAIVYILYIPAGLIFDFSFMEANSTVMGIAVLNTVIKGATMLILLPMCRLVEKICFVFIKNDPSESEDLYEIDSLDDKLLDYTPAALELCSKAITKMCEISKKNVFRSLKLIKEFDREKYQKVVDKEALCDKYEDKLGNYIVKISKNGLDASQQALISEFLSAIVDFERLSDHAQNIADSALEINEKKITFSGEAGQEIEYLLSATGELLLMTTSAFIERKVEYAVKVEPLEETIDEMTKLMKSNHTSRVSQGDCNIETGFVFNDIISNIERIADHCSNIAFCVLHSYDINAEGHDYNAHLPGSEAFVRQLAENEKKYIAPIKK